MAARVLALLAAVAMVVGAVVVRNALDDDDGGGAGGRLQLVCDTTLATVCEAIAGDVDGLDVKVEDAFDTFTRLSAADETADLDGWLVTAPWPGMVNAAQSRASRESLLLRGDILARSPVVMAVHSARQAALAKRCGTDITWKCVGEVAGTAWADIGGDPTWGVVRPGHAPASTSTGLSVLGAGAVSYFEGRTDLSSADLDEGGFRDWLGRLERARPRPGDRSPVQTMLLQPSAYDLVGSIEADAGPAVASAARAKPALLYPSPVGTADVVLAVGKTKSGERIRRAVAGDAAGRALAAAGWRVQGQPPVAGVRTTVTLPSASNLPAPDVLQALLEAAEGAA